MKNYRGIIGDMLNFVGNAIQESEINWFELLDCYALVIPPSITLENIINMVWYGAKAIMQGKSESVISLIKDNL